jgi:hypothetical protein
MCDGTLLWTSYHKIKSVSDNMTPGVDKTTLDGFSNKEVNRIIEELRNETF